MVKPLLVVGHKNPDNDSVSAAVGYAYLKNELARRETAEGEEPACYLPARLGPLPVESSWILDKSGIDEPLLISDVYARVGDMNMQEPLSVGLDTSLLEAGRLLQQQELKALVVADEKGAYKGLFTERGIAQRYLAATAVLSQENASEMAVAGDLITSLGQKVTSALEEGVLILSKDKLFLDAAADINESELGLGVVVENDKAIGIVTRADALKRPRQKVVLVDHNEKRQAVDGIEEAEIVEILDHHRIGGLTTANPIRFLNLPVGSTATIVSKEYESNKVEMPRSIAAVLLSAIMTDTVILKSPTATEIDREQVEKLASMVGVDSTEFGLAVFKRRGGEEGMPVEKLVGADSKEFQLKDGTIYIAQRETVDLPAVLKREDEIRLYLRKLVKDNEYEFALLLATDIMAEGSQFIAEGNTRLLSKVFGVDVTQPGGAWMPGVLSRKKQVAAKILDV